MGKETMEDPKRWWDVEMKAQGHRYGQRAFLGRVEATEAELKQHLGHTININAETGTVYLIAPPPIEPLRASPLAALPLTA